MARTVSFLILVETLASYSTRLAMTGLRLPLLTVLLCLTFSSTFMPAGPVIVSGQSNQPTQITQVKNSLLAAFQALQTAEQKGASNESLAPLIDELNRALAYEMIAEQGNSTAALQSITLSNDVSLKAETLGNQAQAASQDRTILAYAVAIALAFASSIIILEAGRLRRFLEKRRLLRSRIEIGVTGHVA
jgi:hypothetical protein